jgi:hypothetical protein
MKSFCRFLPVFALLALLLSCGGEQQESAVVEAGSLEEALSLAAENSSFVVVEFWMDG